VEVRVDDTVDTGCPRIQGGGCAFGGPVAPLECEEAGGESSAEEEDSGFDGSLEGSGCACASSGAPPALPILLLAVVALRRLAPALVALLVSLPALAADAQQFSPADGGAFAGLTEGDLGSPGEARVALTTSYATDLAVLRAGDHDRPVLASVVTAEVGASLRIDRWFTVGVTVPEHLGVVWLDQRLPRPIRGDVGWRLAVPLTEAGSPVRGSWTVQWDAPSRGYLYYLGDPGATVGRLAFEGDRGPLLLGSNLGLRLQRQDDLPGLTWANRFEYGLGAVYTLGRFAAGAELIGSLPVRGGLVAGAAPAEVFGTVRAAPRRQVALRVGAGVGLGHGLGAPGFRGFVGVDLRSREPRDPDHDGLIDLRDACDDDPEDPDRHQDADGCPDPDNDRDGLLDPVDACPAHPEVHNGWEDEDGCPDELARVVLIARSPAPFEEARVQLEGASPQRVLAGERWRAEVPPGSARLRIEAEGHHAYDREVALEEGPQELIVELEPIVWGELDVRLRAAGQPVAGFVTIGTETSEVPSGGLRLDVEAGLRTVAAGAPGHVTRYVRVVIPRGGTLDATVDLEPLDVFAEADQVQLREELRFPLDGAEPTAESLPALEALAAWLIANPQVELLRVEGHADGIGGSRHNYSLSVRRAEAVRERLIALGVAGDRLVAVGAGEARTEGPGEDASSRKVGLLVLVWNDEETVRPEPPRP
jgi:uncharacterized protein (TIGR03382 family)